MRLTETGEEGRQERSHRKNNVYPVTRSLTPVCINGFSTQYLVVGLRDTPLTLPRDGVGPSESRQEFCPTEVGGGRRKLLRGDSLSSGGITGTPLHHDVHERP